VDMRLTAGFDEASLLASSALAVGYGSASGMRLCTVELDTALDHPAPVPLVVRLVHRVLVVSASTRPVIDTVALARHLLAATSLPTPTLAHAARILVVTATPEDLPASMLDPYLDDAAARGMEGLDRLDGAFAALRAALLALSGRPLGNPVSGNLVARAAVTRL
jgi:hypothetical protein